MSDFTIVEGTRADLPEVVALVNAAYRGDGARRGWTHESDLLDGQRIDAEGLADELDAPDPSTLLLLRAAPGAPILACAMVQRYRDDGERLLCHLAMLTVLPDRQGRGFGRQLIEEVERRARDMGCVAVEMTVIQTRAELLAYYARRGYAPTGRTKPFPYGDERFGRPRRDDLHFVVIEKELSGAGTGRPAPPSEIGGGESAPRPAPERVSEERSGQRGGPGPAPAAGETRGAGAKTIVVTGGTSGVGLAGAVELARRGHRIVLVARDPARAESALRQLRRAGPGVEHALHIADLSRLGEVKRVGAAIASAEPRIDVLVNNAGALFDRRQEVEGFEKTFALDHLSYFALTDLLMPSLKAAAPSRIVCTSSEGHRFATLDFGDLQGRTRYQGWTAYCRAKLANVLFTRELARRLAGTGVTANCFHPGFVASRFGDETGGPLKPVFTLAKSLFAVSPEKGAETLVYLADAGEVENRSGGYYSRRRLVRPSRAGQDDAAARHLWELSAGMTGLGA